ncbi:putative cofD-like protein [Bacillus pakistanensis]|uniref:Gluconeogenesis factor n=1 Tax=Rossellomorea pakistanensis TaxID=992288 RepID=A0ABS2NDR5_9BACI|nr:YvcK family protein [Bacillus pakistanensis]MBM7585995.1 putative cofD-like protein [Bacillus pakistanensis]
MTLQKQPNVVIIGGGTGLPVLLRGLKKFPVDITAIVTVADDGGSSGRLRDDLQIPPPGDIRNVLAALSEVEPLVEQMFQHRFETSNELAGHSLGNLIIAALTSITGDFVHAIQEMSRVLNVNGKVLPAANQSVILNAEMEDGTIVSGESKIPFSGKKIKEVFLTPKTVEPVQETINAIRNADLIIIGPGSLYTSILPNLLVPQIGNEVRMAKAQKVYICNIMTQAGETLDFTASDHVRALNQHMERPFINTILVNNEQVPEEIQIRYQEEKAKPVIFDIEKLTAMGLNVLFDEIISYENGYIRHDTERVAEIIYSLLEKEDQNIV